MGYCITSTKCTIKFKPEDQERALTAFKKWQFENDRLGFTDKNKILNASDLKELLEALRYESHYGNYGNLCVDYFFGEKIGGEYTIWDEILSPFASGYIEFKGEDGDKWKHKMKKNVKEGIRESEHSEAPNYASGKTFELTYTSAKGLKQFEDTECSIPYYPIKEGCALEIYSRIPGEEPICMGGKYNTLELGIVILAVDNSDTLIIETTKAEYHFKK